MDSDWERFERTGDRFYDYFIHNAEYMLDSSGKLKHPYMRYTSYLSSCYYDYIEQLYGEEVHEKISEWAHEEHRSGRLFDKSLWKPFRDQLAFTTMYYGYRKLFSFRPQNSKKNLADIEYRTYIGATPQSIIDIIKNGDNYTYYFQLVVDEEGHYISFNEIVRTIDFQVAFYGWKNDGEEMVQPDNQIILGEDMMMPERHWRRK